VHHLPAGPPLSARIAATLSRWARLLRLPRVVPVLFVVGAVAVVTVGAPMVSGAVTSFTDPVALESTATPAGAPAAAVGSGGSSSSGGSVDVPLAQPDVDGDTAPQSAAAPAPASAAPSAGTPSAVSPSAAATEARESSSAEAATAEEPAAEAEAEAPAAEVEAEPAPVAQAAAAPADPTAEAAVLALVNEARVDAGCGALAADPALAAVARAHSADMRDRDYFSHTSP
jgi:Cysteine-rich secretory protein family